MTVWIRIDPSRSALLQRSTWFPVGSAAARTSRLRYQAEGFDSAPEHLLGTGGQNDRTGQPEPTSQLRGHQLAW